MPINNHRCAPQVRQLKGGGGINNLSENQPAIGKLAKKTGPPHRKVVLSVCQYRYLNLMKYFYEISAKKTVRCFQNLVCRWDIIFVG